jgi:hypothetical protein
LLRVMGYLYPILFGRGDISATSLRLIFIISNRHEEPWCFSSKVRPC